MKQKYQISNENDFEDFLNNNEKIKDCYEREQLSGVLIEGAQQYKRLCPKIMECAKSFFMRDLDRNNNTGDISVFITLVKTVPEAATLSDFKDVYAKIKATGSKNFDALFNAVGIFCAKKKQPREMEGFIKLLTDEEIEVFWDRCICGEDFKKLFKDKKLRRSVKKLAREHKRTVPDALVFTEKLANRRMIRSILLTIVVAALLIVGGHYHYQKWSEKVDPESISFVGPTSVTTLVGEAPDLSNHFILYETHGGKKNEVPISLSMLKDYDLSKPGKTKVSVDFESKTHTFELDIRPFTLDTPVLSLQNDVLTWTCVENADSYFFRITNDANRDVFSTVVDGTETVFPAMESGSYTVCVTATSNETKFAPSAVATMTVSKAALPTLKYDELTKKIVASSEEPVHLYLDGQRFDGDLSLLSNAFYTLTAMVPGDNASRLPSEEVSFVIPFVDNICMSMSNADNNRVVVVVDTDASNIIYDMTVDFYQNEQKIDSQSYKDKTELHQYVSYVRNGVFADRIEVCITFDGGGIIESKTFQESFKIR